MSKNLVKDHGNLPRRKEDDPFFAIWRHYHDKNVDIILTEKQTERLGIYEFAYNCYLKGFSRGETAKRTMVHFGKQGIDFSIRTAFNYLADACDIFGTTDGFTWDLERRVLYETGKMMLSTYVKTAPKAASVVFQSLIKLAALDKGNNELAELIRDLKPQQIIITTDPEALKLQADELMQDVGYEEIDNADG